MSRVPDEERLHRRLLPDRRHCVFADGKFRASASAFDDRGGQVSVNLASMCGEGPTWTQGGDLRNGVAVLVTGSVREIKTVGEPPKKAKVEHSVDVFPRPIKDHETLPDNPAHAQIEPAPVWSTPGAFRRLKEALSQRAEILVPPACVRPPETE
jgi:hypothetical protein